MSAFGVEHPTLISKRKGEKRDDIGNGVAIGAGGTAAGLGLIGGGIPGAKANRLTADVAQAKWRSKPRTFSQAWRSGIFGYRQNAHHTLRELNPKMDPKQVKGTGNVKTYGVGRVEGARAAEKKIISHMRSGKLASNALLLGGAGTVAYGMSNKSKMFRRDKDKVKKSDNNRNKRDAAIAGGGIATGGAALGLGRFTGKESQKWLGEANEGFAAAQRMAPGLKGAKVTTDSKGKLRSVRAEIKNEDVTQGMLRGVHPETAKEAGRLRGRATQAGYFGHVYGAHSRFLNRKVAPLAFGTAAIGGAGLYSRNRKRR